jgi:hypothetical protein
LHLKQVVETWEDAGKVIVTPTLEQLQTLASRLEQTTATR